MHLIFIFSLGVQIAVVALKIFMICTWCCACKFMLLLLLLCERTGEREGPCLYIVNFMLILIEMLRFSEADNSSITADTAIGVQ